MTSKWNRIESRPGDLSTAVLAAPKGSFCNSSCGGEAFSDHVFLVFQQRGVEFLQVCFGPDVAQVQGGIRELSRGVPGYRRKGLLADAGCIVLQADDLLPDSIAITFQLGNGHDETLFNSEVGAGRGERPGDAT